MTTQTITINGTEYTADQLTDEQKYLVNQCLDCDAKTNQLQFQIHQVQAARTHFMELLQKSLTAQAFEVSE